MGGGGRSKSNPRAFVRLATTGQYNNILLPLYLGGTWKICSKFITSYVENIHIHVNHTFLAELDKEIFLGYNNNCTLENFLTICIINVLH